MPAYNSAFTIAESIESVIAQTFTDWELLIIDDGSNDDTRNIAEIYAKADSRITLFELSTNQGVAAARNHGMRHAKGSWLAFLDSDDLWHPEKLERQLAFACKEKASITYTATAYIDKNGQPMKYIQKVIPALTLRQLLRKNIMTCSSVMVKREIISTFPEGFLHEDYAVWLAIFMEETFKGVSVFTRKAETPSPHKNTLSFCFSHNGASSFVACGLNLPLTIYRISESSKSYSRLRSAAMNWNVYRHVGFGLLASSCLTARYALHSISKRVRMRVWQWI